MFIIALVIAAASGPLDRLPDADLWQDMRSVCMGVKESAMSADKACRERDKLARKLLRDGYCFDDYEFEWRPCGVPSEIPTPSTRP